MADSTPISGTSTGPRTPKRVVASRACDSCRTRRIRCLQPDTTNDKSKPCKACREASLRCTFDLLNKRRGPPAKWQVVTPSQLLHGCDRVLIHPKAQFYGAEPSSKESMQPVRRACIILYNTGCRVSNSKFLGPSLSIGSGGTHALLPC